MGMKKLLIIPDKNDLSESLRLAEKYDLGFEYNDFFDPDVLDDPLNYEQIMGRYKERSLPDHCTLHGAFFDVTVFSPDKRIWEVSDLRVKQSLKAAEDIGAGSVIFHTNYNPFLNSPDYVDKWLRVNAGYWGEILEKYPDLNIFLENMFDDSPEIIARLAEKLSGHGNFGICLDYAHASLTPVPLRVWCERLSPYIRHMHINDNDLVSDLHLAVGDGKINWKEFYDLYDLFAGSSPMLIETSSLDSQKKSIEKLISDGFIK